MTTLVDKLKIVLGRKLSEKKLAEAKINNKPEDYSNYLIREGDKILRRKTLFELTITAGSSYRWRRYHPNHYPVKTVDSEYDSNGLLVKKTIARNESHGSVTSYKEIKYDPAGSLFGKKADKSWSSW